MKIKIITSIVLLFSSINFGQILGAYSLNDPVSAAMGNTSAANSTDTYALHRNPANLALMENGTFGLSTILPFPNISENVGTDFLTIDEYNYYFGGIETNNGTVPRELTAQDKEDLMNLFKGGGTVFFTHNAEYLRIAYKVSDEVGAFGFSIADVTTDITTFPQGLIELSLEGNVVGKAYNFNDLDMKASYLRDYSFSYSRDFSDLVPLPLSKLALGVTFSYVQGLAMGRIDEVKTNIKTNPDNTIDISGHFVGYAALSPDFNVKYDFDSTNTNDDGFQFTPFPTPAGTGFGMDFGLTAGFEDYLTVGFAVNNIGSITWNKNVAKYESNTALVIRDITDQDELDSLKDQIALDGKYIDQLKTDLPTVMRLGAALQVDKLINDFPGYLTIAADFIKGFNNEASNSDKAGFGFGLEYRPVHWLPIMTGIAVGNGRPTTAWSLGIGIDSGVFAFTIAAHNFGSVIHGNQAKTVNFVLGSRFRF